MFSIQDSVFYLQQELVSDVRILYIQSMIFRNFENQKITFLRLFSDTYEILYFYFAIFQDAIEEK